MATLSAPPHVPVPLPLRLLPHPLCFLPSRSFRIPITISSTKLSRFVFAKASSVYAATIDELDTVNIAEDVTQVLSLPTFVEFLSE